MSIAVGASASDDGSDCGVAAGDARGEATFADDGGGVSTTDDGG